MSVCVSLAALRDAFDWVNAGNAAAADCSAWVSRATGVVHWAGDGVDEALPDDIEDASVYVAVPDQHELDLGRSLALRFVAERLPDAHESARRIFQHRGAYSRFKRLLEGAGQLDAWHAYERDAIDQALRDWCRDRGLMLDE